VTDKEALKTFRAILSPDELAGMGAGIIWHLYREAAKVALRWERERRPKRKRKKNPYLKGWAE